MLIPACAFTLRSVTLQTMMGRRILQTSRLVLREFVPDDDHFILRLLNSESWLAFIGDRNVRTLNDARAYLVNGPMKSYADNGYGLWCVNLVDDTVPIGMCGLVRRSGLPGPDLGFAFLPEYCGKGYALEASVAVIRFSFDSFDLRQLFAITMHKNTSARNVLAKAGMIYTKDVVLANGEGEVMLFIAMRPPKQGC